MRHWTPLTRWHLRHVVTIWIVVHVALACVLLFAGRWTEDAPPTVRELFARSAAAVMSVVLTPLLAEVDRWRIGAPLLFANLGRSWGWLATTTVVIAVIAEAALHAAVGRLS